MQPRQAVVDGIALVRRMSAGMRPRLIVEEELPGDTVAEPDDLKQFVRNHAWGHHASCTCPIGPESAGGVLTNLREYALAADLLEASARGQATTAAETQRIALLRKVDRKARESVRVDDARGAVLKAHALLLSGERKFDEWRALASRGWPSRWPSAPTSPTIC